MIRTKAVLSTLSENDRMIPLSIEDFTLKKDKLIFKVYWYNMDDESDFYESSESIRFLLEYRSLLRPFFEAMEADGHKRRLSRLFKRVPVLKLLAEDPYADVDESSLH